MLKDRGSLDIVLDLVGDPWPAMRAAAPARAARTSIPTPSSSCCRASTPIRTRASGRPLASLLPALGPARAVPRLSALLAGQDPAVAAAAIEAMAGMPEKPNGFAETLERLLAGGDVMVRAAAAAALGELKPPGGARALAEAYTRRRDRRPVSGARGGPRGAGQVRRRRRDADAERGARRQGLGGPPARGRAAARTRPVEPTPRRAIRPAPGRPVEAYAAPALVAPPVSPHVFLDTDKGTIEIELAVLDAPLTADNFLALARRGFFNGMPIHRVVPTFVVQDGDPRGDGEGGPGYTIRDELNMRPYLRGTVGMALDGADTGGSQFFITHSPQPHLDGKYTVFGRVVAGMDVVDRLQQWDVIRRVRTWDGIELVTR